MKPDGAAICGDRFAPTGEARQGISGEELELANEMKQEKKKQG